MSLACRSNTRQHSPPTFRQCRWYCLLSRSSFDAGIDAQFEERKCKRISPTARFLGVRGYTSTLGFFLAIVRSRSAALVGFRRPCSQLSTAFRLTFRNDAKLAWVACNLNLIFLISTGLSGFGLGRTSVTRKSTLCPFSKARASVKDRCSSLKIFTFLAMLDFLCFLFDRCYHCPHGCPLLGGQVLVG